MENKKGRLALVVEDEKPIQFVYKKKFEQKGIKVVTARSVEEAINFLEKNRPDFVVLDHFLIGKGSGLDLAFLMSKSEKWANIPVFVVTNITSTSKMNAYRLLGVKKCYSKPDYYIGELINDILGQVEQEKEDIEDKNDTKHGFSL